MKALLTLALALASFMLAGTATAQAPRTISFQGIVSDASGSDRDGTHNITIVLYRDATTASPLYMERHETSVQRGTFAIEIGSVTPLPASLDFTAQYWLGISVDGGAELSPRTKLTAAPYAINAASASGLTPKSTNGVHTINGAHGLIAIRGEGGTTVTTDDGVVTISSPTSTTGGGSALELPYSGIATSISSAFAVQQRGNGRAVQISSIDTNTANATLVVGTNGKGSAAELQVVNVNSSADALTVSTTGSGRAIRARSNLAPAIEGSHKNLNIGRLGNDSAGVIGQTLREGQYGVRGIGKGDSSGAGVLGENLGKGDGVVGITSSARATKTAGVVGINQNSSYGVKGTSRGSSGTGVYGEATSSSGVTTGVHGRGDGAQGVGVYGEVGHKTGNVAGVVGVARSRNRHGVYAINDSAGVALTAQSNGGDIAQFRGRTGTVASINSGGDINARDARLEDVSVSDTLVARAIVAQTVNARNLPSVTYAQSADKNMTIGNGGELTVDEITVNIPASGFLIISASASVGLQGGYTTSFLNFNLYDAATNQRHVNTGFGFLRDAVVLTTMYDQTSQLQWVLPVNAGQVRLKTTIHNSGDKDAHVNATNLTAIFIAAQ